MQQIEARQYLCVDAKYLNNLKRTHWLNTEEFRVPVINVNDTDNDENHKLG